MIEKEPEWIFPENLRKQEERERKEVEDGTFDGGGDFGSYYAYYKGINLDFIKPHAYSDDQRAIKYVKNMTYLLQKHDLSFDLSILYSQTEDALNLIKKYQNTLFIINHTLSPMNIDSNNIKDWLDKITLLSSFDNVVIKLSGFGEFNSSWIETSIKSLVLNSIDKFGTERCMFGTNFPVDKYLSASKYVDYWKTYFNIVNDFSQNEIDRLFYLNAEQYYKI